MNPIERSSRSEADRRNNGIFLGALLRPSTPGQCEKSEKQPVRTVTRTGTRGKRQVKGGLFRGMHGCARLRQFRRGLRFTVSLRIGVVFLATVNRST